MPDSTTTIGELRAMLAEFVAEREWHIYHDPKKLSMSIAIEAAELMEHFQWVRNDELAGLLESPAQKTEIVAELADVTCYVLALANVLDIDLSSAVAAKMADNARKYPAQEFRGRYFKPADPT